jgi:hypothetical protein
MGRVVVNGTHDDAARPGSDRAQGRSLEVTRFVARFHVVHFTGVAGCDPRGKGFEFGEIAHWSNAREVESGGECGTLDGVGEGPHGDGKLLV